LFLFSFFSINKMFDGKFIATLLAVAVSVFAICNFNAHKVTSNEGFGMNPSGTWIKQSEMSTNSGDFYSIPGNYQAMLSPRHNGVNYGTYARHNPPDINKLAAPPHPLTYGQMASGNSTNGCTRESFSSASPYMEPNHSTGNYKSITGDYTLPTDMLPVQNMSTINTVSENGEPIQAIIVDRLIHVNRNSRLRRHGDMIRGDLPIQPHKHSWFTPSVHPIIDLQQGAMNVMGGLTNETALAMAELINTTSGHSTISGVDMTSRDSMASLKSLSTKQSMSTLQVGAY
jgi:hypothetical protein